MGGCFSFGAAGTTDPRRMFASVRVVDWIHFVQAKCPSLHTCQEHMRGAPTAADNESSEFLEISFALLHFFIHITYLAVLDIESAFEPHKVHHRTLHAALSEYAPALELTIQKLFVTEKYLVETDSELLLETEKELSVLTSRMGEASTDWIGRKMVLQLSAADLSRSIDAHVHRVMESQPSFDQPSAAKRKWRAVALEGTLLPYLRLLELGGVFLASDDIDAVGGPPSARSFMSDVRRPATAWTDLRLELAPDAPMCLRTSCRNLEALRSELVT
eukprot:gnl/Spiro4/14303_TR7694_c0_g1_i1.p1 gnl/Spiro4/14303_TR7694_c0_g1~~gnl/Spiro4/14303_TR7694_c0_g1_i1.p1  ORF type:complete len:274 (-),score=75.81 gnl/Spiro4/14303_TR7694_c0_g1_i1:384-1205(-)